MKNSHIALILLFLPTSLLAENLKIESLPQETIYNNWLVSRCIGKSTDSEKTREDAFRSASAYLEFSKLPIDAFDKGEELVSQTLQKHSQGSVKGSYHTMECLSLSQSAEAKIIFKKYEKNE
ncbi:Uncharacterised protein [Serratia quinivorans]|uniref:type VI secretion system amidase immunity protein Tai4 n=1 Tax=Serratia quinivorans TaxID=137545 RepID=UPI00217B8954|nr:type VI secretion system amidase immunity protein Tai4 [Serratia quinivorans]CAI1652591.1 Uncharacterised protein [Serratia quinivorans]